MFKCEQIFFESHPKFIPQPRKFKFGSESYRPDFHDQETDTYYEVIGTKSRMMQMRDKYLRFLEAYPEIKIKMVWPDGEEITSIPPQKRFFKKFDISKIDIEQINEDKNEHYLMALKATCSPKLIRRLIAIMEKGGDLEKILDDFLVSSLEHNQLTL